MERNPLKFYKHFLSVSHQGHNKQSIEHHFDWEDRSEAWAGEPPDVLC